MILQAATGGVAGGGGGGTPDPTGTLAVTLNRSSSTKYRTGTGNVTSHLIAASAAGGTAPYTYSWFLYTDYNSGTDISILDPSDDDTEFRAYILNGDSKSARFRVTATDAAAAVGYAYVDISLYSSSDGGPEQIE